MRDLGSSKLLHPTSLSRDPIVLSLSHLCGYQFLLSSGQCLLGQEKLRTLSLPCASIVALERCKDPGFPISFYLGQKSDLLSAILTQREEEIL